MPHLVARIVATPVVSPVLARCLWQWLTVGLLLVLCLPGARGDSGWFGPWPFWLLAAPATALLTFYRHAVAAAWRSVLVRTPRRRRPRQATVQAARTGYRRGLRQQSARVA
ncbi:hypothetical protein [Arenimonas oryziterrae]|uniref:Uncharacterized protein n=1 Tax=Arenimonas oryziterrae DSM 21050 = YC6267 TaxID=1121015 RepID=A0A091AX85_9GAMM|nr:hypothetical protein [Arenimonas oryziterrae]KFN44041.1 hypothetical protein N789_06400 [Arenimonas oryziterrae DSM 21050 = YC6267]